MPPRAIKWAHNLPQVPTEVAGAPGPMGCAAFPTMTKFLLKTMLKMCFLLLNAGMLSGVKYLPGPAHDQNLPPGPPQVIMTGPLGSVGCGLGWCLSNPAPEQLKMAFHWPLCENTYPKGPCHAPRGHVVDMLTCPEGAMAL